VSIDKFVYAMIDRNTVKFSGSGIRRNTLQKDLELRAAPQSSSGASPDKKTARPTNV
jgi:hypothetical protein